VSRPANRRVAHLRKHLHTFVAGGDPASISSLATRFGLPEYLVRHELRAMGLEMIR
jgi:hypothetical protein